MPPGIELPTLRIVSRCTNLLSHAHSNPYIKQVMRGTAFCPFPVSLTRDLWDEMGESIFKLLTDWDLLKVPKVQGCVRVCRGGGGLKLSNRINVTRVSQGVRARV